jgi:hypothetical protein
LSPLLCPLLVLQLLGGIHLTTELLRRLATGRHRADSTPRQRAAWSCSLNGCKDSAHIAAAAVHVKRCRWSDAQRASACLSRVVHRRCWASSVPANKKCALSIAPLRVCVRAGSMEGEGAERIVLGSLARQAHRPPHSTPTPPPPCQPCTPCTSSTRASHTHRCAGNYPRATLSKRIATRSDHSARR